MDIENNMSEHVDSFRDCDGDEMSVTLDTLGTTCELNIFSGTGCFPITDPAEVRRLGELLIKHSEYMGADE